MPWPHTLTRAPYALIKTTQSRIPCRRTGSDLLMHYADYVLERLQLHTHRAPGLASNDAAFQVLLIDRRAAPHGREIARQIPPTHVRRLAAALRSLRVEGRPVKVDVVDFATLPIAQQISAVRQCHLLIAVHGAALALLPFMDPRAGVLELVPPGYSGTGPRSVNNIFGNLAGWFLRDYSGMLVSLEELPVEDVAKVAADLLKERLQ